MRSRRLPAVLLLLTTVAACSMTKAREVGPPPLPASMAALGDSMTRGYLLCGRPADCPEASWSTGTAPDVGSHASRISAARGSDIRVHNLAVSGATAAGLEEQVRRAVPTGAEYVTVLIGANDACAASEGAMTPVARYAASFDSALAALAAGLPRARILVVSIPDLMQLWYVGRKYADVRAAWQQLAICPSMMADAASTSAAVHDRRKRVRERVMDYNDAMARACRRHRSCRWDGNAVFNHRLTLDLASGRDYWHPSRFGQRTLSELVWAAGYWGDLGR